jgi:hypothetical protein
MIWAATFQQPIAEEQVAILKHQLFCKSLPKKFDSLDHSFDDICSNSPPKVIDKNE